MRALALLVVAGLTVPVLTGCEEDPTGGDMAEVAGSYEATTLNAHGLSGDVDILAEGGHLEIELEADGTTTGTFFVPEGDEGGADLEADLTGTWSMDGDVIEFDHTADTFISDVSWVYEDGRLLSSSVYAEAVLTRQ